MRGDDAIEVTVAYEKLEGGRLQATIPAVPGTITTGRTKAEARRNVRDALRLMLTTVPDAARGAEDVEYLELRFGPRTRSRDVGRDFDR